MTEIKKWQRVLYSVGIFALIIGAIDPMEGSVAIAAGSVMATIAAYLMHDRYRKYFMASLIMIVAGVFFLFYLSSLGGFGGTGNGTGEVIDYLRPWLDLFKVDLKAFRQKSYSQLGGVLQNVLDKFGQMPETIGEELATQLAAHLSLDNAAHRGAVQQFWDSPRIAAQPGPKAVELFSWQRMLR